MIKRGFTLIEILVALLAAAIISIMSFEFLSNTVFLKDRIEKSIQSDANHSNAINALRLDLLQAIPYKFKDNNLNKLNVALLGPAEERLLTFIAIPTSDRLPNRSSLRRVIYTLEGNNLIRKTTLSNNENVVLSEEILLKGLKNVEITFGDELENLQPDWPNTNYTEKVLFPLFISLKYEFEDNEYQQIMSFFR